MMYVIVSNITRRSAKSSALGPSLFTIAILWNRGRKALGRRLATSYASRSTAVTGERTTENGESALFVTFNDLDLVGEVDDPLTLKAFL